MRDIVRSFLSQEEQGIAAETRFVFCKSATSPIQIIHNDSVVQLRQGDVIEYGNQTIKGFRVKNTVSANNDVTLVVGLGRFARSEVRGELLQVQVGALSVSAVTVTTGATLLTDSNADRRELHIKNMSSNPIYLGPIGVTSATGFELLSQEVFSTTVSAGAAYYALTASSTAAVRVMEATS